MRLPWHWTPASGLLGDGRRGHQRRGQTVWGSGAALPHPKLGRATSSRAPADLHAHGSSSVQRLNGCQHLAMHPLALQRRPEQRVLHAVIGLLEIHKGCEQELFLELGAVDEMMQGEELALCGHAGTEPSLAWGSEAATLRPADNALIQDGRIQTAEGLPNCYGLVVGMIRPFTLLEDWGHQGRLHLVWENPTLKCSIQDSCKGPGQHIGDTAVTTCDLLVGVPQQL